MLGHVRRHGTVYAWFAVGMVALVDHCTGYELGFFVFYFIPVGLGALGGGRRVGNLLAVLCAVVWFAVDLTTQRPYSSVWYQSWNVLIRYAAFFMVNLLLSHTQALLEQEKALTTILARSLEEVRELRGLLPICSGCKKIRDDSGYWEHIEQYIMTRSKAEFTHSMCPECLPHLYPDFFPTTPHPPPRTVSNAARRDEP